MKKNIITFIIIVTVSVIVSIFFVLNKENKKRIVTTYNIIEKSDNFEQSEFYKMNFILNTNMIGVNIDSIINSQKEISSFFAKSNKEKTIIYRFTDYHCDECVDQTIQALNLFFNYKNQDVIILISTPNKSKIDFYRKKFNIKFPLYYIPYDSFEFDYTNKESSCLMLLDKKSNINSLYIPDWKYPDLNNKYLQGIKNIISDVQ